MSLIEAIERRKSVRVFKDEPLSGADTAQIKTAFMPPARGPFGNHLRAMLLHPTAENPEALSGLGGAVGTYGFIKNAQAFAVGAIQPGPHTLHDFGYLMEGVVLEAVQRGVGSCWLGGSFRPGPFGKALAVREKEFVPAVIALGYPGPRRRIADKLIEMHHNKANRRAEWDTLFYDGNSFATPTRAEATGTVLLRAVHAAPSSCNTQPWRIVRDGDYCFHFFFQRNLHYSRKDHLIGNADLQLIDMGIAMRHFETAAQTCGIAGSWSTLTNPQTKHVPSAAEYLVSWLCSA